jgi:hypothetical protein
MVVDVTLPTPTFDESKHTNELVIRAIRGGDDSDGVARLREHGPTEPLVHMGREGDQVIVATHVELVEDMRLELHVTSALVGEPDKAHHAVILVYGGRERAIEVYTHAKNGACDGHDCPYPAPRHWIAATVWVTAASQPRRVRLRSVTMER